MNRRRFLISSAAALAVGPGWLKRAFADASAGAAPVGDPVTALAKGRARARQAGVPLLAIVIPPGDGEKHERGKAFGEYLMNGSDAQLAPLAEVELVCARLEDLERDAPPIDGKRATPLLAMLEDGPTRFIDAIGVPSNVVNGRWVDEDKEDALIDRRISVIAAKVQTAIGARRPRRDVAIAAQLVRTRLKLQAPSGSYWANVSMCGLPHVEGLVDREADEKVAMDCGMGHVSSKSSRFLYFYTQSPARRYLENKT
jgi:hypothetical protein